MSHFIVGLDEMCIMSDFHGNAHIIGSADKKKHEKILQDSRISITMVRTGTVAGTTGPTIFVLKGTKRRSVYDDKFLKRHGMAEGSTIIMTENAYMTEDAWLEASKAIAKGYPSLPYMAENKDWLMLELLDGFKSHENVLAAHELRACTCLTITNDTQVPDNNYHATKQNDGLDTFQLIPKEADGRPKLTGMDLFQHMVTIRNVNHSRVDEDGQHVKIIPSTELNVEISSDALKCIQPTQSELRRANILHDSFGKRAIRKCAKRKLNNIGNIVGQCAVVNDETNMARMRENLVFAESMAEIVRREKANKTNLRNPKSANRNHNYRSVVIISGQ